MRQQTHDPSVSYGGRNVSHSVSICWQQEDCISAHFPAIEYKNLLTDVSWTPLTSAPGDGKTHSVTNATASAAQRIFRINVP